MTELQTVERARLYGTDAHVHVLSALEGLDPTLARKRVKGYPHSIHQILDHMIFWQRVAIARIEGRPCDTAECAADGWSCCPEAEDGAAWDAALAELKAGLLELEGHLDTLGSDETALRNLRMVEGHNSYHLGQIVVLRRVLGAWPPPRGGDTW